MFSHVTVPWQFVCSMATRALTTTKLCLLGLHNVFVAAITQYIEQMLASKFGMAADFVVKWCFPDSFRYPLLLYCSTISSHRSASRFRPIGFRAPIVVGSVWRSSPRFRFRPCGGAHVAFWFRIPKHHGNSKEALFVLTLAESYCHIAGSCLKVVKEIKLFKK